MARTPGRQRTLTNGITAVTVVSSPSAGTQRLVSGVHVWNRDSVAHAYNLLWYDGTSTARLNVSPSVAAGGCYDLLTTSTGAHLAAWPLTSTSDVLRVEQQTSTTTTESMIAASWMDYSTP